MQTEVAEAVYQSLVGDGFEVLWDDREERPGVKFADAELIGCPVRVTVGKKAASGVVEVDPRAGGAREEVAVEECAARVRRLWGPCYNPEANQSQAVMRKWVQMSPLLFLSLVRK